MSLTFTESQNLAALAEEVSRLGGTVDDLLELLRTAGQGGAVDIAAHDNNQGAHGGAIRRKLTADATIHVRQDGDNANAAGLTGALRDFNGVIEILARLDTERFSVLFDFGPGSWNFWPSSDVIFDGSPGAKPNASLMFRGSGNRETTFSGNRLIRSGQMEFERILFSGYICLESPRTCFDDCGIVGNGRFNPANGGAAVFVTALECRDKTSYVVSATNGGLAYFLEAPVIRFTGSGNLGSVGAFQARRGGIVDLTTATFEGSFVGKKWSAEHGGLFPGHTPATLDALIPGTINGSATTGETVFGGRIIAGRGTVYAGARVSSAGALVSNYHFGCASSSKIGTGQYSITLQSGHVNPIPKAVADTAGFTAHAFTASDGKITVETRNASNAAADSAFTLDVF